MSEEQLKIRELIIDNVKDLAPDLIYYDRKEDEELPTGSIEKAISDGIITKEEIVSVFTKELEKGLSYGII